MKALRNAGVVVGSALALSALSGGVAGAAPLQQGAPSWEGFYLGADAGYGMGVSSIKEPDFGVGFEPSETNTDFLGSTGASVGVLGGYNHVVAPRWLIGIEGDANWSNIRNRDVLLDNFGDMAAFQVEQTSSFSARARFGYLLTPETLLYGTAGAAWSRFSFSIVEADPFFFESESDPHWFAGVQFGAGIETMFAPGWSARLEYLETLYGAGTFSSTGTFGAVGEPLLQVRPAIGVARLGVAYHFGPDTVPVATSMALKAPPAAPPSPSWNGVYIGGALGAGTANAKLNLPEDFNSSVNGVGIAGVFPTGMIGYNERVAPRWVLGAEAEAAPGISTADFQVDWTAALRGRAGFLLTPMTLLYGDAGLLTTGIRTTSLVSNLVTVPSERVDAFEIGGGVEAALNEHWAARFDYQYALPNTINDISIDAGIHSEPLVVHAQIQYVRVGLVYMFGG
jgi:outer membrane immunogenic protein